MKDDEEREHSMRDAIIKICMRDAYQPACEDAENQLYRFGEFLLTDLPQFNSLLLFPHFYFSSSSSPKCGTNFHEPISNFYYAFLIRFILCKFTFIPFPFHLKGGVDAS